MSAATGSVAVTVNGDGVVVDGEVVTRRTWPDRVLAAGARVEVLSIAQGG